MNEEAKLELERILALDASSRTENDLAFLKARSEYHDVKVDAKPAKEAK